MHACFLALLIEGYGQLAPRTFSGRLFCVAYATIGVPFTLVFLSACVQRLLAPTEKFLEVLCRSVAITIWSYTAEIGSLGHLS